MHRKWGGQPNRVLTTAEGLRERGHEVVVSGPRGCMLVERARERGFETFDDLDLLRGFKPFSVWRDVRALRRHFEEKPYDVVDTHGSQDTWAVHYALLGMKQKPAFIRTRHNIFPVPGHPLNKWLYGRTDHVITISPQVIPILKSVVPADKCTSIYSAPDPGRFDIGDVRRQVRDEFGFGENQPVIGVVGRLAPEKGHRHLIDAAPALLEHHPTLQFLFVGTGRSRGELEARIAGLGLQKHFTLTGFRTDVPRLLQAFDLFVLCPTAGESLGTSILEAFLAERPVVATDVGGVRESVIDGVTGRLVEPARPDQLAEACSWMLSNPEQARRLALAGKARVEELFTPQAIATQTEEVYFKALGLGE